MAAALSFFKSQHDEEPSMGMTRVIHADEERMIVRVCYGSTRPPRRKWFAVSLDAQRVNPLRSGEARQFDRAVWR